jgi:hypothetical protein
MGASVEIGGHHGCRVAIEVFGAEGEGFLACHVSIAVGSFSADYRASLDVPAFERFHAELSKAYDTLAGRAEFLTIEDTLRLEVEMTKTGGADIRGKAQSWTPDAVLTFSFDSDQTFLGPVCHQLAAILGSFGSAGADSGQA